MAYLDRVNISIAGQAIAKEFHLTNIELGWIFSAFVLGYALLQAPAGRISDRLGPRVVLGFGVVWWAVFTTLITFVSPNLTALIGALIAIRFLLGIGEAVVYPASNCIVSAWIPSSERGIANGIIFAGVGFGAGLAPPLITYMLVQHGWRSSFWISALLGLIVGAVWCFIARDKPANHPWVSARELNYINSGIPHHRNAARGEQLSWTEIIKNRDVQALTFSYFTYGYAVYIFFSWFFIYLNTVRGLDLKQSSYYTMLPFIAMAAGSPLGGWLSDVVTRSAGKRAGRCILAAFSMFLSAVFLVVGPQVKSVPLAVIVLAGGAGALYLSQRSFWSVSAEKLGDSIDIAVDFHAKTSPSVAAILVKEIEPLHLLFVEEPCPPENVPAMARVSRRSTTPIATGERLVAAFGCRELIEKGIVDILQTDINHVGGITGLWKVAAMANFSNISMAPHAYEGPIGGIATLHVDCSMPNFLIQEICSFVKPGDKERIWADWLGFEPMRMVNGRFPLPSKPGLGFELTEAALAKYPFGGSRPMASVFQQDGSVGEW